MAKKPKSTRASSLNEEDWWSISFEIDHLFNGAPVAEEELFAGRATEVRRILEVVLERSKHVILYGERGVGKTSIANVFWRRYNARLQTIVAARVQADPADTFSSLWNKAFDELIAVAKSMGRYDLVPVTNEFSIETPDQVRRELQKCKPNAIPIIIFDEFDKLRDALSRELFANLIKYLYDYSLNTTIILVGVAEDVSSLIADHQSLDRALAQIKLNRMSDTELNDVIDTRLGKTRLELDGDARWTVITLSRGLPYFTQMLTKYAAKAAIDERSLIIKPSHVRAAMDRFIVEADQSFQDAYSLATDSPQKGHLFKEVLLACALAQTDQSGFFTPTNVIEPLSGIVGQRKQHAHFSRHLSEFISEDRGKVLMRRGHERNYRFRFRDPMMQPYVIIKGINENMIGRDAQEVIFQREQPFLPNVT
ncbi:MAG: AAA family ATPase [Nitratireductor sp.]|nr:AAA family ATPase [Nitratireductor sp.]